MSCSFEDSLTYFKDENFDYNLSSRNYRHYPTIEFDLLFKVFIGDSKYIEKFDLNSRVDIIFTNIFKSMYKTNFLKCSSLKNHIKQFSESSLDDEFLEYLENCGILKCSKGEVQKRDELIEMITLLEVLE